MGLYRIVFCPSMAIVYTLWIDMARCLSIGECFLSQTASCNVVDTLMLNAEICGVLSNHVLLVFSPVFLPMVSNNVEYLLTEMKLLK